MASTKLACPNCRAVLKIKHPVAAGRWINCPGCGTHFAAGAKPLRSPDPVSALPGATPPAGVNWKVFFAIVGAALVLVSGGIALVMFCIANEKPAGDDQKVQRDTDKAASEKDPSRDRRAKGKKLPPAPPKPQGLVNYLTADQKTQVAKAVERGVAFLKSIQAADGSYVHPPDPYAGYPIGLTSLVGLTLLECEINKTDPAVQKAAAFLRAREQSPTKIVSTYEISLALLFLDRLDDPQDTNLIQTLGLRLVAGQNLSGGWTYVCPILTDANNQILATLLDRTRDQLSANVATSKLELKAVDPAKLRLDNNQAVPAELAALAVWRSAVVPGQASDNSNTQFAILGLWAAKTRGLPVQRALARIVQRFHQSQGPDGSWNYQFTGQPLGGMPAMTCAGLLGLATGQGLVNEARGQNSPAKKSAAQQDPAIQRGLDYLARQVGDPNKPWRNAAGAPPADPYFMWSTERVGVIFNLSKIGGKDWYGWGAEKLIANQVSVGNLVGSWPSYGNPTVSTCFALLFLKQANLAKDLTSKLMLED